MKLPYNIYSNKRYWSFKNKIQRLQFSFRRQKFNAKKLIKEEKEKANSTITHINMTLWSIFKSIAFVSLLFSIEYFTTKFWTNNLQSIPQWLIQFQHFLPKPSYPDDRDAIIELISVIASITGVILALFYPILATIASTAYAKVHASIRNLLLYEKETQGYLRRLTYLTACSITVLLFLSFHILPGNLVLSFLAFYSFTTLFGILKIGLGVYNFFEPSTLAGIVFTNITDAIKNVTSEGEYWDEKNFQKHNYRIAFEQTENLALITSLSIKDDDLKESSFKKSIQTSFYLLKYYLRLKPRIPINSLWFPNSYSHTSFFESDMNLRGLSKNTKTFIQPSQTQNYYWLEDRIINNISNGLDSVVKSGNINVLGETILMTHSVFDSLSSSIDLRTGESLLNRLLSNLLSVKIKNSKDVIIYEDWRHEIGSVETYCYALMRFQVGIIDRVIELDSLKMNAEFDKIDWKKKEKIYDLDLISDLYEPINRFYNFIENEETVEGKQITPNWYFRQSITAEYLGAINYKIKETIRLFETHLLKLGDHFNKENNPLLASFSIQIGIEIIHKIQFRFENLKKTLKSLDSMEVCKDEFRWTKPNFLELETQLKKNEISCISIIVLNFDKLSEAKWNNQFPDVFAHSYSLLSSYMNNCFYDNNITQFQNCFPNFLKASIKAFGNLNSTYKHFDRPQNISYQTLIDSMEISGYAYIYSVIYNKPEYWTCVKEAWDANFAPSKTNIELMVSYYGYYKSDLHGTGINYTEKHERDRTLAAIVEKLEIRPKDIDDWLVKPFVRNRDLSNFYDLSELFIEIYLFTFIESKNATTFFKRDFFKQWCRDIETPNPKAYSDDFFR